MKNLYDRARIIKMLIASDRHELEYLVTLDDAQIWELFGYYLSIQSPMWNSLVSMGFTRIVDSDVFTRGTFVLESSLITIEYYDPIFAMGYIDDKNPNLKITVIYDGVGSKSFKLVNHMVMERMFISKFILELLYDPMDIHKLCHLHKIEIVAL